MDCAGPSMILRGALTLIDLLLAASIEAGPIAAPPLSPLPGQLFLVAATGASGAFAGQDNALAGWTDGGWRFMAPVEGMRLTARASGLELSYRAGAWESGVMRAAQLIVGGVKVVGNSGAAIPDPTGGATIDSNARTCLGEILSALRLHGLIQT